MNDFEKIFCKILKSMFASEAPENVGQDCSCQQSGSKRLYHCNECFDFESCCAECWLERHVSNPFHWAEFWDGGFLKRKDISELGHVIPFCHGEGCSSCISEPGVPFIVVDVTGIHATKVAFCTCASRIDKHVDLLLRAQIFPSTTAQPTLGFTFNVLRDFHLQTLTSKKSSYDYLTALSRRSDNAFSGKQGKVNIINHCDKLGLTSFNRFHILNFCAFNASGVPSQRLSGVGRPTISTNCFPTGDQETSLCHVLHVLSRASTYPMSSSRTQI